MHQKIGDENFFENFFQNLLQKIQRKALFIISLKIFGPKTFDHFFLAHLSNMIIYNLKNSDDVSSPKNSKKIRIKSNFYVQNEKKRKKERKQNEKEKQNCFSCKKNRKFFRNET